MKKSGAEIITALLERQGITTIAGIPGGGNLPLYDALRDSPIKHVLARHEQGAGFIAQGMARATGKAAVCLATSGPGVTNLVTAIADAKLDSVPLVAITGQVPSSLIGTDAFQEVDTFGMTLPLCKHNYFVKDARELLTIIPEAFRLAQSGRPGPVVVDVPKDVQQQIVEFDAWPEKGELYQAQRDTSGDGHGKSGDCTKRVKRDRTVPTFRGKLQKLANMIHRAERPILYAGGGVISADASDALSKLSNKNGLPVTLTLNGLGAFSPDDPKYLGMLGMHGATYTNKLLDEADLLVAIGVRFDDRATGRVADFCQHAAVAHIDIDASEIGKIKPANLEIVADAKQALDAVLLLIENDERKEWNQRVSELKAEEKDEAPQSMLHPQGFLRELSEACNESTIITTDVGQHQMWVAQFYPFRRPRTLQTSGGLGTMGFGLPAAIGAALVNPKERVVCISGDGSFLMNIQELATLAQLNLNVTVFIMNNGHLGLVRQQQELFFGERYHAVNLGQQTDFCAIARGFGISAYDLGHESEPALAINRALKEPGPALVNVPIPKNENVLPMVPPGAANHVMITA